MYQAEKIQEAFKGLVGFTPADDPSAPEINESLTSSLSGLYVSHPLCTIENISQCAPQFEAFAYKMWTSGSNYKKNAIVTDGAATYRAKIAITNSTVTPGTDTAQWAKIDPFSTWLSRVYDDASVSLCREFLIRRKVDQIGKSLAEIKAMYSGSGSETTRIVSDGRFVGVRFKLKRMMGMIMNLDKIGFQSDTAQEELNFYLYHSSNPEPLFVLPVPIGGASTFSWTQLQNTVIGYMTAELDPNGVFFFGYYQDDLVGQAIQKDVRYDNVCSYCNTFDKQQFDAWSKYAQFDAIEVPGTALQPDNSLFDTAQVTTRFNTNWGLNLAFSFVCDITDMFSRNKMLMADYLKMQIELKLLEIIAFNNRLGDIAVATQRKAGQEMNDKETSSSYLMQYRRGITALRLDMSGINSTCFPCDNKNRINKGAV